MAQTVSPPPAGAPRPLPRRGPNVRAVRPPRLVALDGLWIILLAVVSAAVSALMPSAGRHAPLGAACAAGTTALLYLLGWRARDRSAGVIAGLLLATCLPFALHALSAPREAVFVLLTVAGLFSFVAGSSLLALAFAGLATLVRPEALPLGLLLLVLAFVQGRKRAVLGAGFFAAIVLIGGGVATVLGHARLPALHTGTTTGLLAWAVSPDLIFLTWMLLPFCAELGEAPRRARWLPVVLWTLVLFIASCFVRTGQLETAEFALTPLWFALAAGGVSRLLPVLTGEIPMPWVRYGLASLAVLALVAIRLRVEWPRSSASAPIQRAAAPTPSVPTAPPHVPTVPKAAVAVPAAAAGAATVAALHHAASPTPPKPAPKPIAVAKPVSSSKPAVPAKPQPKSPPKPTATPKAVKASPAKPTAAAHPVLRARPVYRRYYRPRTTYRRGYGYRAYHSYYRHY